MNHIAILLLALALTCTARAEVGPAPATSVDPNQAGVIPRFADDRLLVKFRPGTPAAQIASAHRQAGAATIHTIPGIHVQVVAIPAGTVNAGMTMYSANPNVIYAEPDYNRVLVVPVEEPGPTPAGGSNYFDEQWYLENTGQPHTYRHCTPLGCQLKTTTGTADADVDAADGWDRDTGTPTTSASDYHTPKVAVLDSGADCNTLELAGKCLEKVDYIGARSLDSCAAGDTACDNLGHGTFTASEAAANTDNGEGIAGIGWHTSVGIFKVCYQELVTDGSNLFVVGLCPVSASAQAIVDAASDQPVDGPVVRSQYHVITMSYGSDWIEENGEIVATDPSNAECDAIKFAHDNGVVVVAAAGNNGDTSRVYPAACTDAVTSTDGESTVIAVAASDHHDYRASFSTYSQINDPWVALSAPGDDIIGILPDAQCGLESGVDSCVDWWEGTSMAAPLVAGAAALVWNQLYSTADESSPAPALCTVAGISCNRLVRQWLEAGADKIGAQGQDMTEWTRHGRLNLYGALMANSSSDSPPEVTITDPADGATVSAQVTITADASDDIGVDSVSFSVDNLAIGEDTDGSDGWSTQWDTTVDGDGGHTIGATATDSGAQTASHTVAVTVDNAGAEAPVATFNYNCNALLCSFDGTASSPAGAAYQWTLGDGNTETAAAFNHTYQSQGRYDVSLTVTSDSQSATATVAIRVKNRGVSSGSASSDTGGDDGSGGDQTSTEKGRKKCSDGIDNDGDGLVDSEDPDC